MSSGLFITRTPLRVSFAGGGTDLPDFYEHTYGAVFSTTIKSYIYVTVKLHGELFNEPIRLNYSETELVKRVDDIENSIARECLRLLKVEPPIYISVVADIPASSGLGSSSSFAVGLLNALHAYRRERVSASQLAEEAAHVEIEILQRPIGLQDHYAAAYGGLNYFSFMPDGRVTIESQRSLNRSLEHLFDHILMFWTGMTRDSSSVLSEQKRNTHFKRDDLLAMRGHALQLREIMSERFDPVKFGTILDHTWGLKRQLTGNITNDRIDTWYRKAIDAGAFGGKLCGAGGGGFLLFIVPSERQPAVREVLRELRELSVGYESQGSRLLFPTME